MQHPRACVQLPPWLPLSISVNLSHAPLPGASEDEPPSLDTAFEPSASLWPCSKTNWRIAWAPCGARGSWHAVAVPGRGLHAAVAASPGCCRRAPAAAALPRLQLRPPCSRKAGAGLNPASPDEPTSLLWELLFGVYRMRSRGTA